MLSRALGVIFSIEAFPPRTKLKPLRKNSILAWSVGHSLKKPTHHHCSGVVTIISSHNFQHAKASAKENKKSLGLEFNPGPSAPRADGTRDAKPNVIGPFSNLDGLITYILVQGAKVDHSDNDADTDEAPAPPPKPQKPKKAKASKSAAPPKISRAKPLATTPPEDSV